MQVFLTTLLLIVDEIALMVDRIASPTMPHEPNGATPADLRAQRQSRADGETRIVWAVVKGSVINKVVLVPAALLLSVVAPWALLPLLMIGGLYLCHEGAENVLPIIFPGRRHEGDGSARPETALTIDEIDIATAERQTVRGAIMTDFVLSAEIIVIILFSVAEETLAVRTAALAGVALFATVGVYSVVTGFLRLDDAGFYLTQRQGAGGLVQLQRSFGGWLIATSPRILKVLSGIGTVAAFLIGGAILAYGVPGAEEWIEGVAAGFAAFPAIGAVLGWAVTSLLQIAIGIVAGVLAALVVLGVRGLRARSKRAAAPTR
jgi:predicted DNA repair protein MutK